MNEQTSARGEASELYARLLEKHDILSRLAAFFPRQQALIQEDRVTALLELLTEKQNVLQELANVQAHLEPYRHQDPASRNWPSAEMRQAAREVAHDCEELLQLTLRGEAECEQALHASRHRIVEQMDRLQLSAAARQAYDTEIAAPAFRDFGLS